MITCESKLKLNVLNVFNIKISKFFLHKNITNFYIKFFINKY